MTFPAHRFSVAPMLDWTDRHCRYFLRQISRHALLYTEMVTTGALIHGKGDFLAYHQAEHPVALQLGGSNPSDMARCAEMAQSRGYDEVNINVGCPSDRVQNGSFGACLMAQPQLVAESVRAMQAVVDIPVTVKCRIGIDDMDEDADFQRFIEVVAAAGCKHFIVHARKAWLQGLSPKENRDIPPLNYERVFRLKTQMPELTISLNGGIDNLADATQHLQQVDGVMLGREVYKNPYILAEVDRLFFADDQPMVSRAEVVMAMYHYAQAQIAQGARVWHIARHTLGLFNGQAGGRLWRRHLSQNGIKPDQGADLFLAAYDIVLQAQQQAERYQNSKNG